jgi:hypothetical protein
VIGYAFTGAIAISEDEERTLLPNTAVIHERFLKRLAFLNKLGPAIPLPAKRKKG